MSVPAGKRSDGKLKVLVDALDLAAYTVQICKNQNVFKPEYNSSITDEIVRLAISIYSLAWKANNIRVCVSGDRGGSMVRMQDRLGLQAEAAALCNELLPLIDIARKVFHLKYKRVEYWGRKVIEVRAELRSWRESDRKRYSETLRL